MKQKRMLLFRLGALVLVLLLAAAMMVIGRGHTVYFDNKTLEVNGQSYDAFHRVDVYVNGERVAKLGKRDRGMAETMGQKFQMTLEVTPEKGDTPDSYNVTLNLPYHMDGVLINVPALLSGLTEDAFLSELEVLVPEETEAAESDGMEGMDGLDAGMDAGLEGGMDAGLEPGMDGGPEGAESAANGT